MPLPKGNKGRRINTVQDKINGASSKISIFDSNSVAEDKVDFIIGAKNIDIKASRYPDKPAMNNYFGRPMTSGNTSIDYNTSKRDNPLVESGF